MSASVGTTCRAMRCNACGDGIGFSDDRNLTVAECVAFEKAHDKCTVGSGPLTRAVRPEANVLQDTGEWSWCDPSMIRPLVPS